MKSIEIVTYTGKIVDILNIKHDDICIEDIAHSLALQCRYTGHIKEFYSVAQHCVLMSQLDLPTDPMARLMHDSAETYIADIATMVKRRMQIDGRPISFIENDILSMIEKVFDIDFEIARIDITLGDKIMLSAETKLLMPMIFQRYIVQPKKHYNVQINPWNWQQAKQIFTQIYHELKGKR